jgi:hypothetical protein
MVKHWPISTALGGTLLDELKRLNIDATGEQRVLALDLNSQSGISSGPGVLWALIRINAS